jgi:hypothetical protein
MGNLVRASSTIVVLWIGALSLVKRLGSSESEKAPHSHLKRRPRMSKAEMEAAYLEASRDQAYVSHMGRLNAAFDGTLGDGLESVAR